VDKKTDKEELEAHFEAKERKRRMKMYPALALVYDVYIDDNVTAMAGGISQYIDDFYKPGDPPEDAVRLKEMMIGISEGTAAEDEVITEACQMIEKEMKENPRSW
jgi:hypothetical protein